ncbi:hypothetical protein LG651_13420 [Tamlana sp. 62-3]|uniref:Uncharacterized protein n=1 Tax=Neotamlana sargassicola TaxID=2883125 RepID=A0A9X1IAU3_9FLAO|nr:hypothetical protein [Tamlana sargassicola]MCB4809251.1 hypothetical protein [Tamlana sargassicola]
MEINNIIDVVGYTRRDNQSFINSDLLPIGTKVTIVDNVGIWGTLAGQEKTITGYVKVLGKIMGYECDEEGFFLNHDFQLT